MSRKVKKAGQNLYRIRIYFFLMLPFANVSSVRHSKDRFQIIESGMSNNMKLSRYRDASFLDKTILIGHFN